MNLVYPWYEFLSADTAPEGTVPVELIRMFSAAVKSGDISIYSETGVLLPPNTELTLDVYVMPGELNDWFDRNRLPYSWEPSVKRKNKYLKDLLSDLELAVKDEVKRLRKIGTVEQKIDKFKVSGEIIKLEQFKEYKSSTIERHIKASWWKLP